MNKRSIYLIITLVVIALGAHNIYSSLGVGSSGNHIDEFKLGFSIILVAVSIAIFYRIWKSTNESNRSTLNQ